MTTSVVRIVVKGGTVVHVTKATSTTPATVVATTTVARRAFVTKA